MNSSIYIFGNMQQGYTQYPDDETTHEIFQNYALNAKAPTQLAIHRNGTLMYYGYLRMLEGEQYIGLCVMLNNVMLTNISALFSLFEHTIAQMAELGFLIKFGTDGSLMGNTEHLYMSPEEVSFVTEQLRNAFERQTTAPIPPTNYSIPSDSVGKFTVKDATGNILFSAYTNGYTYVYKSEGYNTVTMDSYQGVLAAVNDENESLKQQIDALKGASTSSHVDKSGGAEKNLLRGIVVVFAIILIGGGIFAYQQVKDNKDTQEQINHTQELVTDLETQQQHTENVQAPSRETTVRENKSTGAHSTASLLHGFVKDEDGYTNVRQGPGTNYEIVTTIKDGSMVYYTVYNSKWNIVYDNYGNALGYMYYNRIVQSNHTHNNTANNSQSSNDGYVTALSTRKLNVGDIDGLTNTDLTILRNMIYARHGYRFKRDDLFQYFSQFFWYHPTTSDMTTVSAQMSDIEQYNVNFIKSIEQ